jgi:hypothetical protein
LGVGILGGIIVHEHWVVSLEPKWTLPSSPTISGHPSVGARVGSIGGDFHVGFEYSHVYAGALFELERLKSAAFGIDNPKTNRSWWTGCGFRFAYGLNLTAGWSLVPRIDGLAGLQTLQLQVLGQDAHKTPPVLVRVGIALETRF